MSDNMKIWDAVCKTDPAHTKQVNQRGGFTAIDAQYQIKNATKQFGAIGVGWGYYSGDPIFSGELIIVPVTMWHGSRDNIFGPIYGCAKLGGERVDTDAPKKATTDAITKGLSQIGFNSDVFEKKFDDNKYIEGRKEEVAQENIPFHQKWSKTVLQDLGLDDPREKAVAISKALCGEWARKPSIGQMESIYDRLEPLIAALKNSHPDLHATVVDAYELKMNDLTDTEGVAAQ